MKNLFLIFPSKVDWYNLNVDKRFQLKFNKDTLCVLVLNTPRMFEELFLPYLFTNFKENINDLESLNDPIDKCLAAKFEQVKNKLEASLNQKNSAFDDDDDDDDDLNIEITTIKDYETEPATRRAKIVMQTVAHISGAAYYYSQNLIPDCELNNKKVSFLKFLSFYNRIKAPILPWTFATS